MAAPDIQLEQQQQIEGIDRCLEGLPEIQRAAFLLFYREDMPTAEIAKAVTI